MGYNMSSDVALGQLGSGFVDNTGAFLPPAGKVVIAITFLSDLKLSALTAELPADATFKGPINATSGDAESNSFGTVAQTAANGTQAGTTGYSVAAANVFPKGLTIYGRWKGFTLSAADSTGGVIAYFGY
tara:strand:+ start:28 stop:417 length:390 start_codon:yes stop_codon:yes gene_type:complete